LTEVVIVGAGGMGREAAAWIDAAGAVDLVGFLDDDPSLHGTSVAERPVLGGSSWLWDHPGVRAVLAVGTPAIRGELLSQLDEHGARLATVVHPAAVVGPRVTLGDGAIVCPGVVLTCDIDVGRAAILNYGAMVGHDATIGEAAFVAPGVHLGGAVSVGAQAEVGIGASVIQGVAIGERAVVGAGAVVIGDVAPDTTVVGVPARPIRPSGG
jgi:sugar O-acyltransferase (sialic acid O-acetyltransferase NeuD family)